MRERLLQATHAHQADRTERQESATALLDEARREGLTVVRAKRHTLVPAYQPRPGADC